MHVRLAQVYHSTHILEQENNTHTQTCIYLVLLYSEQTTSDVLTEFVSYFFSVTTQKHELLCRYIQQEVKKQNVSVQETDFLNIKLIWNTNQLRLASPT